MTIALQKKLLLEGADIIDQHPDRLTTGLYRDASRVCAAGAMFEVGKRIGLSQTQVNAMFGLRMRDIWKTNDRRGRKSVIALMRTMAAAL